MSGLIVECRVQGGNQKGAWERSDSESIRGATDGLNGVGGYESIVSLVRSV
jgi:hypothetical protein